jgi:hypothetical protein
MICGLICCEDACSSVRLAYQLCLLEILAGQSARRKNAGLKDWSRCGYGCRSSIGRRVCLGISTSNSTPQKREAECDEPEWNSHSGCCSRRLSHLELMKHQKPEDVQNRAAHHLLPSFTPSIFPFATDPSPQNFRRNLQPSRLVVYAKRHHCKGRLARSRSERVKKAALRHGVAFSAVKHHLFRARATTAGLRI